MVLTPFNTATGAGMAGERQERTDRPVEGGRQHPQGSNAVEDLGEAQVAACRDGPTGQRRSPARSTPEANAIAPAR